MSYNINSILNFGKYKNYSVFEIYQFQPSYIEYLLCNSDNFCIEMTEFDQVLIQTPFREKKLVFKGKTFWINNLDSEYDYIYEAYQYISEGNVIMSVPFIFSDIALKYNNNKLKYSR